MSDPSSKAPPPHLPPNFPSPQPLPHAASPSTSGASTAPQRPLSGIYPVNMHPPKGPSPTPFSNSSPSLGPLESVKPRANSSSGAGPSFQSVQRIQTDAAASPGSASPSPPTPLKRVVTPSLSFVQGGKRSSGMVIQPPPPTSSSPIMKGKQSPKVQPPPPSPDMSVPQGTPNVPSGSNSWQSVHFQRAKPSHMSQDVSDISPSPSPQISSGSKGNGEDSSSVRASLRTPKKSGKSSTLRLMRKATRRSLNEASEPGLQRTPTLTSSLAGHFDVFERTLNSSSSQQPQPFQFPKFLEDVYERRIKRPLPQAGKRQPVLPTTSTSRPVPRSLTAIENEYSRDLVVMDRAYSRFGDENETFGRIPKRPSELFDVKKVSPAGETIDYGSEYFSMTSNSSHSFGSTQVDQSGNIGPMLHNDESFTRLLTAFNSQRLDIRGTIKSLSIGSTQMAEPLYCTLAIYDIAARCKITEDMFFAINPSGTYISTGLDPVPEGDVIKTFRAMIVPQLSIRIIIKFYRVFRGDPEKDVSQLAKGKVDPSAVQDSLRKVSSAGNSDILQPLFWTSLRVIRLNGPNESPLVRLSRALCVIPVKGVLTDDFIYDTLANDSEYYAAPNSAGASSSDTFGGSGHGLGGFGSENAEKLKKMKAIPARIEIEIVGMGNETFGQKDSAKDTMATIDTCFTFNNCFNWGKLESGRPINNYEKVLQSFDLPMLPAIDFINNLYLFPEYLAVKHSALSSSSTHLQVSAKLVVMSEILRGSPGVIPAAYPRLLSLPSVPSLAKASQINLVEEATTSVQWGESKPQFSDELKFCMPLDMNGICVLFTFFSVSPTGKRQPIGYSVFEPICNGRSVYPTEHVNLPISSTPSEAINSLGRVISPSETKKVKYYFGFHFTAMTTVFPKDEKIARFLAEDFTTPGNSLKTSSGQQTDSHKFALEQLSSANSEECSKFFFPMCRNMLMAVAVGSNELSSLGFRSFVDLIIRMFQIQLFMNKEDSAQFLQAFSDVIFDPSMFDDLSCLSTAPGNFPFYVRFAKGWLEFIVSSGQTVSMFSNWFMHRLLSKSALHSCILQNTQNPPPPDSWRVPIGVTFQDLAIKIMAHLIGVYSKNANRSSSQQQQSQQAQQQQPQSSQQAQGSASGIEMMLKTNFPLLKQNIIGLGHFWVDMTRCCDRGVMLSWLWKTMTVMDPMNDNIYCMSFIKAPILRVAADYEHYVPFNNPLPIKDIEKIDSIDRLEYAIESAYPIANMILHELETSILQKHTTQQQQSSSSSTNASSHTISMVRAILRKHDTDPRYTDPAIRSRIADMYIRLLLILLPHTATLDSRDLFLSLTWLLNNCSIEAIRAWWTRDTESRHLQFFSLLNKTLQAFENYPKQQEFAINAICRLSLAFVHDFVDKLREAHSAVFDSLLSNMFISLDACSSCSIQTLQTVSSTLTSIVNLLPEHFYKYTGNAYLSSFSYAILHCATVNSSQMSSSFSEILTDLILMLFTSDFTIRGNTARMKVQMTIAVSNLLADNSLSETQPLLDFLQKVNARAASNPQTTKEFKDSVADTSARISQLCHMLRDNQDDPDTLADIFYENIKGYSESPELRYSWLEMLASKQISFGNFEEAAQCYIFCALIKCSYLADVYHISISPADFDPLTPNVESDIGRFVTFDKKEETTTTDQEVSEANSSVGGVNWSLDAMVGTLDSAIKVLRDGWLYEQCIEVLSLEIELWKRERDFISMQKAIEQTSEICEVIIKSQKDRETRLFARYYRVAFFGDKLGKLDGAEYIYKRPPSATLNIIHTQIKKFLASHVGGREDLVVLLPNKSFERSTLNKDNVYFQMSSAEPFIDEDGDDDNEQDGQKKEDGSEDDMSKKSMKEKRSAYSSFDVYFGINKFISVQAYSEEGKKAQSEDIREQRKKKIVYTTEMPFPFIKNRIPIVSKEETILEPLENAIELIIDRCNKITEQLESDPPRINPLQQVLQGSVVPMVNEGPMKICETFLPIPRPAVFPGKTPEESEFNKRLTDVLATAMSNFMSLCSAALQLNEDTADPRKRKFTEMLETQFAGLQTKISPHLDAYNRTFVHREDFSRDDLERKSWRELPRIVVPKRKNVKTV